MPPVPATDRPMTSRPRRLAVAFAVLLAAASAPGCDGCSSVEPAPGAADAGASRLTPEQAGQVLARVGERVITLGDYAAALERMDPFERMRYQTEDRRQALLDEMINVELLAREAERRGIDRRPETIELVRQYQRDELLARLRASLPRPEDIPAADVSQYYQEHRAEFQEDELRQAAQIVVNDAALARRISAEARGASPDRWRELVQKYDPAASAVSGDTSPELPPLAVPGDLGYLSAVPDEPVDSVPPAVRAAVYKLERAGEVSAEPVESGGRFHVVRLVAVQPARLRSLAEVDVSIRTRLIEVRREQAERELIERARQSTVVKVDPAALEHVDAPPAAGAP
jgi:peptidyl-prolyl cis-trans isomerase C